MIRSRPALALLVAILAVVTSRAQPPGFVTTPTPLAVTLLPAIDDENLVAELKLTQDQVKALVAHRQAMWDEAYTTAPKKYAEGAQARTEATDTLLKKTLTADQYKRLVQIAAQNALRGFGGDAAPNVSRVSGTTLNRYPELVTALKLTDAQKKQLDTSATGPKGARTIALSPEQTATAKEFLGATYTMVRRSKIDPKITARPVPPAGFSYLNATDVRTDVNLTDEQVKALDPLHEKWAKLNADRLNELSPKEADARAAVLLTETEKALAATLKPEQTARLKQIVLQVQLDGSGGFGRVTNRDLHIETVYTNATVAKELALTEAQATKIREAREAFQADAAKGLESADSSAAAEKKLKELAVERRKKIESVLTPAQATKLAELVGKPFTGSVRGDNIPFPSGTAPTPLTIARRTAMFGNHTNELDELAGNKAVQDELNMKPEQIKMATELRDEIAKIEIPRLASADPEPFAKAQAERSKKVADAVAKVLDKTQAARFREIMVQFHEKPTGIPPRIGPLASAVTYPGVAEAVKLTADQKKKLIEGGTAATVLDADQRATLAKMAGTPFKGEPLGFAGTRPGGPFSGTPVVARRYATFGNHTNELDELAGNKAVQDELRLKPEQIKMAAELRDEIAKIELPRFGPTTVEAYAKAYTERSQKVADALAKVLDKTQAARFREIMMQFRERGAGAAGGPLGGGPVASTVSYPGAAQEVKLSDDQRTKLILGTAPADVLTADQKATLAKMAGPPFKGDPLASGPGTFPPLPTLSPVLRVMNASNDGAAKALGLSPDQSKKLSAAWAAYTKAVNEIPVPTGPGEAASRTEALAKARADFDKAVEGLLTADQEKRLAQLVVQINAAANLGTTLTAPAMVKALGLSDDQTLKVRAIGEDAVKLQALRVSENVSDPELKLAHRLRDAADERMLAVLTDSQKTKWKELTGDPLAGLQKSIPSRFGPGGPGGGGFGQPGGGFGGPGGFGP